MSILVFAIAGALLISGCEKQDAEDTPATVLDMSASSEAPIDVDVLSETVENVPTETSTTPVSEQTATTESTPQIPHQQCHKTITLHRLRQNR